jgi:hypothetical protein
MTTMGFFLRCWKNVRLECLARHFCVGAGIVLSMVAPATAAEPIPVEVAQIQVDRQPEGLYLSASLQFELPFVVEEALLKGVPMYFVAEADLYRARWYWADKKLLTAERHMRLAYHPLTRRWRTNVASGPLSSVSLGLTLNQTHETFGEAVTALRRIARWKIAEAADVDAEQKHSVEFRFKLDMSRLPRPFQIGALGQADWNISASSTLPVLGGK